MTAQQPVAYRHPRTDEWLCPPCGAVPVGSWTPLSRSELHRLAPSGERRFCAHCGQAVWPEPCAFCEIIEGSAAAEWVLRPDHWPDAVAFLAARPLAKGHCLLVSKRHVHDFAEDPEVTAAVARRAAQLMRFTVRPMELLSLRGREAGQEVPHLHLHLVPRKAGDGLRIVTRARRTDEKAA